MQRRCVTVDVFTDRVFGGNQLAVVLDTEGLSTEQMQAVAAEFNYSETTFVLPPRDAAHDAWVRIFTPRSELPFAGHPNVGTACVLAWERQPVKDALVFEEAAGLVAMRLARQNGVVVGAELTAPGALALLAEVSAQEAAACLSLEVGAIRSDVHAPRVVSVGMPFLMVELADEAALQRARPNAAAHETILPPAGTKEVYAYVRRGHEVEARMFAPIDGITEDAATGSAAAAIVAFLLHLDGTPDLRIAIRQGGQIGRPSLLKARAERDGERVIARVDGNCVPFMHGVFAL